MIRNQKGKGIYDWIQNNLFSNEGGEKLDEGEKHVPQLVWKNGLKIVRSSYSGPGTNLEKRLKRGDKPVSIQDKTAQAHDIRYELAKDTKNIREADNKMKSKLLSTISFSKPVESLNNIVGYLGIAGKTLGEDIGVFKSDQFTSGPDANRKRSKSYDNLLKNKLQELEQEGFGSHKQIHKNQFGYGCDKIHHTIDNMLQCEQCISKLQRDIQKHEHKKTLKK